MKYKAKVTVMIPMYAETEVEVEARNQVEARAQIRKLYEADKLDFDDGEVDYDAADIDTIELTVMVADDN